MGAGKDEDGLVGVGQQDLLIHALRARVEPDEGARPRLDLFDHAAAVASKVNCTRSPRAAMSPWRGPCFRLPRSWQTTRPSPVSTVKKPDWALTISPERGSLWCLHQRRSGNGLSEQVEL